MSDVNVLLCAVDSAMNTLAAFDRDRADVTARVSFALGSVLARVALETEQCRRALADAEATSYTDEETGNTAENPEAARLRARLDALHFSRRCAFRRMGTGKPSIRNARKRCSAPLRRLSEKAEPHCTFARPRQHNGFKPR